MGETIFTKIKAPYRGHIQKKLSFDTILGS